MSTSGRGTVVQRSYVEMASTKDPIHQIIVQQHTLRTPFNLTKEAWEQIRLRDEVKIVDGRIEI